MCQLPLRCLFLRAGIITTNTFRFNRGQNGGTLWLNAIKKIQLDNNILSNNTAEKGSAGIEINQCNADVGFCSFMSQKGDKGAAIYAQVRSDVLLYQELPYVLVVSVSAASCPKRETRGPLFTHRCTVMFCYIRYCRMFWLRVFL